MDNLDSKNIRVFRMQLMDYPDNHPNNSIVHDDCNRIYKLHFGRS